MSILVTGGLGAIGSWVVRDLLENGQKPIIYDLKINTVLIKDIEKEVPIIQGDILDFPKIIRTIKEHKVKRVIHLAAELGREVRKEEPIKELKILVDGTANILEAARLMDLEKVVYASSFAVYGKIHPRYSHPTYEPLPEEEAIPGGETPIYSASKFLMERVGLHHVQLGVDFVALRFGAPYGPGKLITYGDKRHVFDRATINSQILENAMKGEPTRIPKGGDIKRCAVYVKDAVQGVIRACFAKNPQSRIYNISVGEGYSFKDWAKVVKELFPGTSVEIGIDPLGEVEIGGRVLDISKARRELSYEPQYPLRKGIEDYVKEMDRLKLPL